MTDVKKAQLVPVAVEKESAREKPRKDVSFVFNGPETNPFMRIAGHGVAFRNASLIDTSAKRTEIDGLGIILHKGMITDSALRLLMFLEKKLTELNELGAPLKTNTIVFTTREYLALQKKKDTPSNRKEERETIKRLLDVLLGVSLEFSVSTKSKYAQKELAAAKKSKRHVDLDIMTAILQTAVISRDGTFTVQFTDVYAKYLCKRSIMCIPNALFSVDSRMKHALVVGFTLCLYYRIKAGARKGPLNHSYANMIKLSTLAESSGFPKFDYIKKHGRNYYQRIREPMVNILDNLVQCGVLSGYRILKKDGSEIPDDEYDANTEAMADFYVMFQPNIPILNGVEANFPPEEKASDTDE